MAEIKVIKSKRELAEGADPELVELLEIMTQEAREGKITSIVGITLEDEQPLPFTCVEVGDELKMLGALTYLIDAYKNEHLSEFYEVFEDD